jgi:hypothetical protein
MISLWCGNMMIVEQEMSTIKKLWLGILDILICFGQLVH